MLCRRSSDNFTATAFMTILLRCNGETLVHISIQEFIERVWHITRVCKQWQI